MINTTIQLIDHENVKIYRKEPYDKPNGAEGERLVKKSTILMSVQGIKSSVKIQGLVLDRTLDGSKISSTFMCYSANVDIRNGDILERIERDDIDRDDFLYEVVATEPKGVGTIMEYRETMIKKVDNQKAIMDKINPGIKDE